MLHSTDVYDYVDCELNDHVVDRYVRVSTPLLVSVDRDASVNYEYVWGNDAVVNSAGAFVNVVN